MGKEGCFMEAVTNLRNNTKLVTSDRRAEALPCFTNMAGCDGLRALKGEGVWR